MVQADFGSEKRINDSAVWENADLPKWKLFAGNETF